ncbi:MAG: PPC domain-containing protein [Planctomycetaceae bacterium]|nr:PPC domain-containing protein [Planctomycetaceae bacterium]
MRRGRETISAKCEVINGGRLGRTLFATFIAYHFAFSISAAAEPPAAPNYDERYLTSIYPSGAQRGTSVGVELRSHDVSFKGAQLKGLREALGILVDGPTGITVGKVENVDDITVRAELTIAADAVPGRRMLRVLNKRTGLTNFSYFTVGTLPEALEKEKNNEPNRAQDVALPVVVNGRLSQTLDVDCYRFTAKQGQKLVAAVAAHDLDSRTLKPRSMIDAALEVLDAEGRIVADAADTLGLDPLVEFTVPADGAYVVRVKLVNFQGYPTAAYRLTLGAAPYPTALFPVAVERGKSAQLALAGPNVPAAARLHVALPAEPGMPVVHVASAEFGTHDLPLLASSRPTTSEQEPNDAPPTATSLAKNSGVSGRFDAAGDVDHYRLALKKGDRIRCEITAQRHLRSPADTHLALLDAKGNVLQENDDLASTDVENLYDFESFDAAFHYDVPADGDYYVRVTEQTGTFGPRAVYHLEVFDRTVDVKLHAWPDAVPVWGPGGTAAFVVTLDRFGAKPDVELRIVGLPDGWQAGGTIAAGGELNRTRAFLTVTAPPSAKVGDVVEFAVVGRFQASGQVVERVAQPLTSYMPDDRQFCRVSPKLRAVVAQDLGVRLSTDVRELEVPAKQNGELAVRIAPADFTQFPVSVNVAGNSFKCNVGVPQKLPVKDGVVRVPIVCESFAPGVYPLVVALGWDSETRKGLPGPCTKVVLLKIAAPGTTTAAK